MIDEYRLSIKNLYKEYPLKDGTTFETLNDISMDIKKEEFVTIIGPSGSGKSTLFNIISGLESPTEGDVLLDGQSIIDKKGYVSYMPQKDHLLPWRNILDNVILGVEVKGMNKKEAREIALSYMEVFGLTGFEKEYPNALSGGMRQRAALLRTILLNNDVLLLDEPFGALDEITRVQMQDWLLSIRKKFNHTIIFVTHSIDEAIYLSDRIYVFSKRPASIKYEIDIDLPKDREFSILTDKNFIEIKKELMDQLK